jgi:hypothetical protein
MTVALNLAIVKGLVADYAKTCAKIQNISDVALARILREIADELEKSLT